MMPLVEKFKSLSAPVKYAVYTAAGIIVFLILTMLVIPAVVKAVAISQLSKKLSRTVSIESISFNPFGLCVGIKGFAIHEPNSDKVFLSFDELRVDAEIMSAFKLGAVSREMRLAKPYVNLVRTDGNVYNISDLLTGKQEETPKPQEKTLLFSIGNIQITDGAFDFDDLPKHAYHKVTEINLTVPLVSNFDYHLNTYCLPSFSAKVNGKLIELTGKAKPFDKTQETHAEIELQDFDFTEYITYIPAELNFRVPSGRLSTKLMINFVQHVRAKPEIIIDGRVALEALEVVALDGKPILKLPSLAINGIACNVNKQDVRIDEITSQGLRLHVARGKDGTVSLQNMVASAPDNETKAAEKKEVPAGPAWSVKVKHIAFSDAAINVEDNSTSQPVQLVADKMNFTIDNIATDNNSSADIDFNCVLNSEGKIGVRGACIINPLALKLNLDLANIDMRPMQGYMPEDVKLLITNGNIALKGTLDLKKEKEKVLAGYQGDIGLYGLAAVSKNNADDLLKLKALDIKGIRAGSEPLALDIDTIKLAGLTARPVVEQDGTLNFAAIQENPAQAADNESVQGPGPPAAEKPEESPLPPIRIGGIILENSRVQFVDKSIQPRYATDLSDIKGRIANISSQKDSVSAVRLSAKLNRYAPLNITGSISPLQEKRNADIKITFKDIDLTSFSPYSGRFVGRLIEKGKLSLDLAYLINDNQLTAQNKLFLDQFTFGGSVASEQATSLPVGLAVSLLKNRKGEIHLNLPISGSLDDPEFSVTKILLKTLVNILEKAALSPFSLIGAIIPGGEDLSQIAFDCGSALIPDNETKKIDTLVDLLADKTDLKLEIQGQADAEMDRVGLRETMFMRKLKVLKLKDLAKKGQAPASVDEVVIEQDEYEDFLTKAYRAEKFKKPSVMGIPKSLPAEEMKKLMLEQITVTDDDMRQMLEQRAIAMKNRIVDSGKVGQERLFILEPQVLSGKGKAGCCVEFKLK
jgi:uncharacterized protein involved in outer membrane biogenesis